MKEAKGIFNSYVADSNMKLSHKLMKAYNLVRHPLEYQFICLLCRGISVNPLFCKHCGNSYCQVCITSIHDFLEIQNAFS